MKFRELLDSSQASPSGGDPEIAGVEYDSRRVRPGHVFVAMRGETTDGNRFIDAAIKNGAVAVISDSAQAAPRSGTAWARVEHGRRALAIAASRFYGAPAETLRLTGITGTNGKTTTTFLVDSILRAAGRQTLLVGTIEYRVAGEVIDAPHTTPESLDLVRLMRRALEAGATEGVMEVSSHALAQGRVHGLPYAVAVFSNLTRDHLDYHRDMDEYFAAKRILFTGDGSPPPEITVINTDDAYGARLAAFSRERSRVFAYGLYSGDFRATEMQISGDGTRFELQTPAGSERIASPLLGKINVYNILAASAAAFARGCTLAQIADGVRALRNVPGRFERVDRGQPFTVVVDYAHTDDALRNLMVVARDFIGRGLGVGRVITVFGCGGDRDRKKRPLMGLAAGAGSDLAILTSDNPRSEDPMDIINEAEPGLEKAGGKYKIEPDRRKAIALAISEARPGDIVAIAGKGHERVQVLKTGPVPFSDVDVAAEALAELGFGQPSAANSRGGR